MKLKTTAWFFLSSDRKAFNILPSFAANSIRMEIKNLSDTFLIAWCWQSNWSPFNVNILLFSSRCHGKQVYCLVNTQLGIPNSPTIYRFNASFFWSFGVHFISSFYFLIMLDDQIQFFLSLLRQILFTIRQMLMSKMFK